MAVKKSSAPTRAPAISIIVAMYNAERYIEAALQSLLDQTFSDYEVIVVDDCSTDQSASLVKSMSDRFDGRLNLIRTKKNCGAPAQPRNLALKVARGRYVTFLDNDDLLPQNAIADLIAAAEQFDADIILTERGIELRGSELKPYTYQRGGFVEQPTSFRDSIAQRVENFVELRFLWDVWGKAFRRDLLNKYRIEFPRVALFEDFCFFLQALINAECYVRIPSVAYTYRNREDSLSHDPPHPFDITRNMIDVFRVLDRVLSAHQFFIDNRKYRWMLLDFFARRRLDLVSKNIYALSETAEIDEYLRRNVFNVNPEQNVALTSYLFDCTNLALLTIERLASENHQLRRSLESIRKETFNG